MVERKKSGYFIIAIWMENLEWSILGVHTLYEAEESIAIRGSATEVAIM